MRLRGDVLVWALGHGRKPLRRVESRGTEHRNQHTDWHRQRCATLAEDSIVRRGVSRRPGTTRSDRGNRRDISQSALDEALQNMTQTMNATLATIACLFSRRILHTTRQSGNCVASGDSFTEEMRACSSAWTFRGEEPVTLPTR
jgi:hypothetical protein